MAVVASARERSLVGLAFGAIACTSTGSRCCFNTIANIRLDWRFACDFRSGLKNHKVGEQAQCLMAPKEGDFELDP